MCKVLQLKKVPTQGSDAEEFVNFRKLLLTRFMKLTNVSYLTLID